MATSEQLSETDPEQAFLATAQKLNCKIVEVTIPVRRGHLELVLSMCRALYHTDPRPMLRRMLEASIETMPGDFDSVMSKHLEEAYLIDPKSTEEQPKQPELECVDLDDY